MKPPSPFTYHIIIDRSGYAIVDSDGEPVEADRFRTWTAAAARLTQMEGEEIEAKKQEQQP